MGAALSGPVGWTGVPCLSSDSAIFAGVGTIGLGLDPVEGCILPLVDSGFLTFGDPMPGLDQVCAVSGAEVAVHPRLKAVDGAASTVLTRQGGLRGGLLVGELIACFGSPVPFLRSLVTNQSREQEVVYFDVPFGHVSVSPVGSRITFVGHAVALISSPVALGSRAIPQIRVSGLLVTRVLEVDERTRLMDGNLAHLAP